MTLTAGFQQIARELERMSVRASFAHDFEQFEQHLRAATVQLQAFDRAMKSHVAALRRELNYMRTRLALPVIPLALLGAVVIASSPQPISRRALFGRYLWARRT